ncbi:MAG: hypothetical protein AAFX81_19080 [Pseudomonadota bacterium]
MSARRASVAGLLLALVTHAAAADTVGFDRFVRYLGPLCNEAASTLCFEAAFAHVDSDGDRTLTVAELERVRGDLRAWSSEAGPSLPPAERNGIALGLWVVDTVGLAPLVAAYDVDGDGRLTPAEMTADVRLDDRRLAAVVRDPDSVDWASLRQRFGLLAGLLDPLAPPGR